MMIRSKTIRWTAATRWWVLIALLANLLLATGLPAAAQDYNPHFGVWPAEDRVEGWNWYPDGDEITVTVGTFIGTASTDESGNFHLSLDGFDLQGSDLVTVTDDTTTKTHIVTGLVVDSVDPAADKVFGRAADGSEVSVYAACDEYNCFVRNLLLDNTDIWEADFSADVDIGPGTEGWANQGDDDGDSTQVNWRVPNPAFTAWPEPGRVDGWDWQPNGSVTVTLNGVDSDPVGTDDGGNFSLEGLDLQAGDEVTVTDGASTKTHYVTSLIVSNIDPGNDTVSGTATAGGDVQVFLYETGQGLPAVVETDGAWTAEFGGVYDIVPGTNGWAQEFDAEGDSTSVDWYLPSPRLEARPEEDVVDGWDWPEGTTVDLTIDRGADPLYEASADAYVPEWDPGTTYVRFDFQGEFDLQAGDTVTLSGGGLTKVHPVTELQVLLVDPGTNTVSGTAAAGSEVWTWIHEEDNSQLAVTATGGDWSRQFSPYVLTPGTAGPAVQYDNDGDATWIEWEVPNPTFAVAPGDDWVQGWEWPLGATVDLEIDDPLTTQDPDYSASTEVVEAEWDPEQTHFNFELWDVYDIQPGHKVTVSDGVSTKAHTVTSLAESGIDYDADTVSGTANAGGRVSVWYCDEYGCANRSKTADGSGNWTVDFANPGQDSNEQELLDLVPGMELEAAEYDEDSDSTQIRIYGQFLFARVNQSHSWVDGRTTPGSSIVATVWRDGLPIVAGRTGNGGGSNWNIDFQGDDDSRLQFGDLVEVETSGGQTALIEIIPMDGTVDAAGDRVFGQFHDVPFPADVLVEVWQSGGDSQEGTTDNEGNFDLSFPSYDIQPGNMVFIAYLQPDGHQVGIIRHALLLEVHTDSDIVRGQTTPGTEVHVSLNGGDPLTGLSDADGYFEVPFDADIGVGDTIAAHTAGQSTSLVVADVSANVDEGADRVWGSGPPRSGDDQNMEVCLDHDCRWTSTDENGDYEVHYDRDISAGDHLRVQYQYPDGHRAIYGFGPSDVGVDKWAPIYNVSPGDEFIYRIRVYNNWSGTATNVQLVDTLPDHVTYLGDDSGVSPTYDPTGNTLTWDLGTLGGERQNEIELHLQLDDNWDLLGGRLNNDVEISADNDRDPGNNSSQSSADITMPGADFWVDKELASGQAIPGGLITYRVRFGNRGNRDGEDAVLTDLLPANTTFEGSTYGACAEILDETETNGQVEWNLDTLPPGGDEGCEFEFSLRIDTAAEPGSFLTNEILISPDTGEWADNRDNRRLHNTVVQEPAADLWVDKVIEGDFSDMESEILYRITFRNDGNIPAQDVSLLDTLPAQMDHVWHSAGSVATLGDGTVTWDLGSVAPGAGGELLLGARLKAPVLEGTVMTNVVNGATSTEDVDPSNNTAQAELGPPRAIAVPWVGTDPHRVWDGLETTLKGVAKGYGLTHYQWDFGDESDEVTGSIDDPYAIEARHTYSGESGDTFVATLTVWGAFGWSHSDTYYVGIFDQVHGVEKDVAIDEALWYQHKAARRYRSGGLPFAEWGDWNNQVAQNATAVQAYQIHGHLAGGDPGEDPYVEDVRAGWNALLTYAVLDPMTTQPAGDPDSNNNGVGVGLYQDYGHSIYEAGLAMMALASSGDGTEVARTGPVPFVRGQTYEQIAQDMADWFAWGQNDADWARGGWRYQPNSGDSDNSNTQFPVLGLAAAEDNWGITVPAFVKNELRDYWLVYTQNENGAFGYSDPWGTLNVAKTGAGIMNLYWTGVAIDDDRIVRAAQYIEDHWNDPMDDQNMGTNVGDFYAMYAIKKGSQVAGIIHYGPYYWDLAYTSYLVDNQQPDGRFDEDRSLGQWFGNGQPLATSWALLILSEGLYEALPVAIISPYQYDGSADWYVGEVQFDGTLSHHTHPDRELVGYDWDFGDGGTASGSLTPDHTYVCQGLYPVHLTVTDDQGQSDTDTLLLTVQDPDSSVGPIVAPGDPVALGDQPIHVSAGFYDAYVHDTHTAVWDWGDGSQCNTASDSECALTVSNGAGTATGYHTYMEAGVYAITLTVTDGDCPVGTATYKYVVIYDPDGGFVTGGGWIWSEPGWCQLDELCADAEGKANFGFVSKYKKGANVPSGNTQFNFSAGGLNFHSNTYQWLVINRAGTNAQYKGSGTINGELAPNEEAYKFLLWARDKDPDLGDTFRIKIWYEIEDDVEVVVYDNGHDQPIDGGNITIHTSKK